MTISQFEFATAPRIVFRPGAVKELPTLLSALNAQNIMLVTDPGLRRSGLVDPVIDGIESAGMTLSIFDEVEADPPVRIVMAAVERAAAAGVDAVIGFGGGSAMDTAKLVAYLAKSPCDLETIYGVDLAKGERLPLILAPTTAGTGSEVTSISIVTTNSDEKRGVVSRILLPDIAVLDPETTLGLPPGTTAATGIDAMVHAIEAYTSKHKKNPLSDVLARQALTLLATNLPVVMQAPGDIEARGAMLLGSCLAGMAFANAPVAAVHALAYPLGGRYHVPHGLSNALMLAPVLRFNMAAAAALYGELADCVGACEATGDAARAQYFVGRVEALIAGCQMPQTLRDVGVTADSLDMLAEDAMRQTRLLVNNPVDVTLADARQLYQEAF